MAMSLSTSYTGRVAAVNAKGLRLDDQESWFNLSKFATDVILPERGETVTVVVDQKGFLRAVQPCDASTATNGHAAAPAAAQSRSASAQRDTTITRLAVLKAASEFAAARPNLKSGDVLAIAANWERWVARSDVPSDDLTDAF